MFSKPNFNSRSTQKELLDENNIDADALIQNLEEFVVLNKYLGGRTTLMQAFNKIYDSCKDSFINKKLTIADLGCGAGDLLIEIHHWAKRMNIAIDIIGFDYNQTIVDFAKSKTQGYQNISIKKIDLFSPEFKEYSFDIVCFNTVCHHFSDEQLIQLISALKNKTKLAMIINDLRRNFIAYYAIKWITKLFNLSKLAQHDGPLSVLKAFNKNELKEYLLKSNIKNAQINKTWAFRWQVIIWLNHGCMNYFH